MLTDEEKERYQRSILTIGEDAQESLKNKKILQIGLGGLGSPLSLYLVAAGIGEIIFFENDTLSRSNLGRQILYSTKELEKSKAQIAYQKLSELNPNCKLTIIEEWFTLETIEKYLENVEGNLLKQIDYIVDASDNFNTKYLVNDIALKYNIPCTIAGIQSFYGQIISVIPHESSCYRCAYGDKDKQKHSDSASKFTKPIPVVPQICGVVGSIEANEVIKGVLNIGKRILNQIFVVNLKINEFDSINLKPNPNCICREK